MSCLKASYMKEVRGFDLPQATRPSHQVPNEMGIGHYALDTGH